MLGALVQGLNISFGSFMVSGVRQDSWTTVLFWSIGCGIVCYHYKSREGVIIFALLILLGNTSLRTLNLKRHFLKPWKLHQFSRVEPLTIQTSADMKSSSSSSKMLSRSSALIWMSTSCVKTLCCCCCRLSRSLSDSTDICRMFWGEKVQCKARCRLYVRELLQYKVVHLKRSGSQPCCLSLSNSGSQIYIEGNFLDWRKIISSYILHLGTAPQSQSAQL